MKLEILTTEESEKCRWKKIVDDTAYPQNKQLEHCAYRCNGYNKSCSYYTNAIGPGSYPKNLPVTNDR
jgi:hypothetical protein